MKKLLLLLVFCSMATFGFADEKLKIGVTGVLHPYFGPMETAAKDYMKASSIPTKYRATQHFDMEEANVIIDGMVTLGYNAFAMWPGHPNSVNATITELLDQGIPTILIAGPAKLPTDAKMCIATDVGSSAAKGASSLIKAMGGKGNIVNLLGNLSDPNTLIRKKAIEDTAAKYPDIKIIAEISGIDSFEAATAKMDAYLSTKSKNVDGMISTAYVPSVVGAQILTEMGDKRIKFVGIDDDAKVLEAISAGYVTGTMTQSPYGQAFAAMEGLRLLNKGYTIKKGVYFVDSGSFIINSGNVDSYKQILKSNAEKMVAELAKTYFDNPK
ncbi:MAG: substrate-binding domain-containing protein [Deltaproteobacteria bacterium]|jgi:ribose transport system substrate-binding protein|nr:substrate-binding domain-containing protein [Deltaproteobacteria bacterium]